LQVWNCPIFPLSHTKKGINWSHILETTVILQTMSRLSKESPSVHGRHLLEVCMRFPYFYLIRTQFHGCVGSWQRLWRLWTLPDWLSSRWGFALLWNGISKRRNLMQVAAQYVPVREGSGLPFGILSTPIWQNRHCPGTGFEGWTSMAWSFHLVLASWPTMAMTHKRFLCHIWTWRGDYVSVYSTWQAFQITPL
jgi:hypothetical protein